MKIFLCGHGSHHLEDGFFTLPRSTTVTFYHDAAKLMAQSDVESIVSGRITAEPARVVEAYKSCPNMTLGEDSPEMVKPTENALATNPDRMNCRMFSVNKMLEFGDLPRDAEGTAFVKLKDIIEAAPGHDYVWTCCYNLPGLYRSGISLRGWKLGVNQMQYLEGGDKYKENLPRLQGYDLRVEPWGDGSKVPTTGKFLLVVGEDNGNVLHIRQFDGTGKRTDFDEKRLRPRATIDLLKKQIKGVSLASPILPAGTTWDQIRDEIATLLGFKEDKDILLDRGREAGLLLNPGEINRLVKEWILGNKLMPESEFKKLKTADLIKWSANQLESNSGLPARRT